MTIDADDDGSADAAPGTALRVAPGVRLLRAPNPSPMTGSGTNTWIVGTGRVAVIDPGPVLPAHLEALRAALGPAESVSHILVTHAHRDHSGLAPALARATGAPVFAAGGIIARRQPAMARLAEAGGLGGGEGVDAGFVPDRVLEDGARVAGPDWELRALATPGHTADHLALQFGDAAFTGDHVMGWASSLISPPDGDLAAFLDSCARLRDRAPRRLYPGHGWSVADAIARVDGLVEHRRSRERAIVDALHRLGFATPAAVARAVYTDTPEVLLPAATRNVLAHLVALCDDGRVIATPTLSADARFALR